jgi:hypothetical protein
LSFVAAVSLVAGAVEAEPRRVDGPASGLEDAWGHRVDARALDARPVLVVYEDRASSSENEEFKRELSGAARGGVFASKIALLAVADVESYDFWPARPLVADAIKQLSRRFGTDIYCDWDGSFRAALGLHRGSSNVLVIDRSGRVTFAHAGRMTVVDRSAALDALRRAVE